MPCFNPQADEDDRIQRDRQRRKAESMLCAIIRGIGIGTAVAKADLTDAGVTPEEMRAWWRDHKNRDRRKA